MRKIIPLMLFLIFSFSAVSTQTPKEKSNSVGKWKFEAPYAPEGYTSGIIEVTYGENKYSTLISFTGSDYKISGENVKIGKDSVNFIVYIESNEVLINLKMDGETKMNGKASYSEGEIPLTLTKYNPGN